MRSRDVAHVVLVSSDAEIAASVYVAAKRCLDSLRELLSVVQHAGAVVLLDEDGCEWRWRAR